MTKRRRYLVELVPPVRTPRLTDNQRTAVAIVVLVILCLLMAWLAAAQQAAPGA